MVLSINFNSVIKIIPKWSVLTSGTKTKTFYFNSVEFKSVIKQLFIVFECISGDMFTISKLCSVKIASYDCFASVFK